jgi:phosphohistidine swiveling domain-containing protein
MSSNWFSAAAPVTRRVRAYFAPVNRAAQTPVLFDPAKQGAFSLDAPPAPWISLGWIQSFTRKSSSKIAAINTGIPAAPLQQTRETLDAQVSFEFLSWTKLTMALATGSQHMNVLAPASGAVAEATGAQAISAVVVQTGSTPTTIALASSDAAKFSAGQLIAVDADYTGQTGFVGSPISGAYVRTALTDVDYIRRITFNVAAIASTSTSGLSLAESLPGGAPAAGARLQAVTGFVDREGGAFFQEWSALFIMEGSQGERIFFHYPRLQPMTGAEESLLPLASKSKLERVALRAQFLALPVTDPLDNERIVCYRSFLPAPNALV